MEENRPESFGQRFLAVGDYQIFPVRERINQVNIAVLFRDAGIVVLNVFIGKRIVAD